MFGEKYSLAALIAVLHANDISECREPFTKDNNQQFDIYFRTHSLGEQIYFLKDAVEYFLTRRKQCRDRRVAFIVETNRGCYILLAEWSGFKLPQAEFLLQDIERGAQLSNIDAILSSVIKTRFVDLYDRLIINILSPVAVEVPLSINQQLINEYGIKTQMVTERIEDIAMLVAQTIRRLTTGLIDWASVKKFTAFIEKACEHNSTVIDDIFIIVKYRDLLKRRLQQSKQNFSQDFQQMLKQDHQLKCGSFSLRLNLDEALVQYFTIEEIRRYANLSGAGALSKALVEEKQACYQNNYVWEQVLQTQKNFQVKNGLSWSWHRVYAVGNYCYQRSFAGTAGSLAQSITAAIATWINKDPIWASWIAKIIGTALGLLYMYLVGFLFFFPMIIMVFLAENTHDTLDIARVNSATATVGWLPSVQLLVRIEDLFVAALNVWLCQNPDTVLRSLATTSASTVFEYVGSRVLGKITRETGLTLQGKNQLLFLISMSGMYFGNAFFDIYKNVASKFTARSRFLENLERFADQTGAVYYPEYSRWAGLKQWITTKIGANTKQIALQKEYVYYRAQFSSLLNPIEWFTSDNMLTVSIGTRLTNTDYLCHIIDQTDGALCIESNTTYVSPATKIEHLS